MDKKLRNKKIVSAIDVYTQKELKGLKRMRMKSIKEFKIENYYNKTYNIEIESHMSIGALLEMVPLKARETAHIVYDEIEYEGCTVPSLQYHFNESKDEWEARILLEYKAYRDALEQTGISMVLNVIREENVDIDKLISRLTAMKAGSDCK